MRDYYRSLCEIEQRCNDTVRTMAQGVLELKDSHHVDKQTEASIQYFLDRFYMSRIRWDHQEEHFLGYKQTQPTKYIGIHAQKNFSRVGSKGNLLEGGQILKKNFFSRLRGKVRGQTLKILLPPQLPPEIFGFFSSKLTLF